jgi:hypothetical protein
MHDTLVGSSLCLFEDGGKIEKVVYAKIEHACVAMSWFSPFFGSFPTFVPLCLLFF